MYHNLTQYIVYYYFNVNTTVYDILLMRCNSFTLLHLVHLVLFLLFTRVFATMLDRCYSLTPGVTWVASVVASLSFRYREEKH